MQLRWITRDGEQVCQELIYDVDRTTGYFVGGWQDITMKLHEDFEAIVERAAELYTSDQRDN